MFPTTRYLGLCIYTTLQNLKCHFYHFTTTAVTTSIADLWQIDRAKLDTLSINVQRYSQNHAQNWILAPLYGVSEAIYALYLKLLTQRNFVEEFYRENSELAFLSHPFWEGA